MQAAASSVDRYTEDFCVKNLYNASGQRVRRVEGGATTNFFYNGNDMLFTTNQFGQLLTENILDPNGEIIASARFIDTTLNDFYFYNYDPHGNTSTILDPSGTMKIAYVYDAFGNEERSGSPSFLNEVMMTKSVKDKSTKKVVNDADGTTYDTLLNKPLSYYALSDEAKQAIAKAHKYGCTCHQCKASSLPAAEGSRKKAEEQARKQNENKGTADAFRLLREYDGIGGSDDADFWNHSMFTDNCRWYLDESTVALAAERLALEADLYGPVNPFLGNNPTKRLAYGAAAGRAGTVENMYGQIEIALFDLGLLSDTVNATSLDGSAIRAMFKRASGYNLYGGAGMEEIYSGALILGGAFAYNYIDGVYSKIKTSDTPVIGKMNDLKNTRKGEYRVADKLKDLGSPRANWKQNSGVLRTIMNNNIPIKDVSPFPMENAGFLGLERNLLQNHGWTYNNGYWIPPNP